MKDNEKERASIPMISR